MTSTVRDIAEAVRNLPASDLAEFRAWFAEFDGDAWDRQIEADIAAGRLDALADKAIEDFNGAAALSVEGLDVSTDSRLSRVMPFKSVRPCTAADLVPEDAVGDRNGRA